MKFGANAVTHFAGGVIGVSESEDLVRASVILVNQVRNATSEDRGLSGTSARDDQQRSVHMLNGLKLVLVRNKRCGRRNGARSSHWAGAYQRVERKFQTNCNRCRRGTSLTYLACSSLRRRPSTIRPRSPYVTAFARKTQ